MRKKALRAAACLICAVLVLSQGVFVRAVGYDGVMPAASALLVEADTGSVLYEKAADARVYPASTTKILTALVVLEHTGDIHETVTVDGSVLSGIVEGDDSTLEPMLRDGEHITVEQLLYGLLLVSGNDCAMALARHVGGSTDAFVSMMNEKAAALGMADSHFQNPHGVQDDEHYTTARDMARLARAALDTSAFMDIVSTDRYIIPATDMSGERQLLTSDRFLAEREDMPGTACPWVTGMKTGYTPTAGGCLVTSAERDGRRLLCLIYGDESDGQRDRWFLTKALLEYGFEELGPAVPEQSVEEETEPAEEIEAAPARWKQTVAVILGMLLLVLAAAYLLLSLRSMRNARRRSRERGRRAAPRKKSLLPMLAPTMVLVLLAGIAFIRAGIVKRQIAAFEEAEAAEALALAEEEARAYALAHTFAPVMGETADPSRWGVRWEISENGQTVSAFRRSDGISFGDGGDYFALPGVASFRGGNYRDGGSYGTAEIRNGDIAVQWTADTGSLTASESTWTGSGWTGQPLIVQWDAGTRAVMDLYPDKKTKDGLVEVVYATLDGHVYFLDLDDGSYTRDPIMLNMPFKGSGALDPRGYPLLYVGAGDSMPDGRRARMFVVSLIDGSVLYESGYDDGFALRQDHDRWCAFDSSPLVDAETDTLIWPGENGVLYTIKLNTRYDKNAGTVSVSPEEPVRARYTSDRSNGETYWYGMESSAVIVGRYLYVSENGGLFFCVDLDSMELVWTQDTLDDSNSTPVFEPDGDNHGYIYTAPSLHWTAEENSGSVNIYKLDAVTGDVVWSRSYDCYTVDGVSGGVQSSPVLGREGSSIDGLVIYGVSRSPWMENGLLVALDTATGCEVWRLEMDHYAWSSPAALYDGAGNARLVLCDSAGAAFLIDAASGQILSSEDLGSLVEASPAAYGDTLVVGTRGQKIVGLRVS